MDVSLHRNRSNDITKELQTFLNEIAAELNYEDFKLTFTDDEFKGTNFLGDIGRVKIVGNTRDGEEVEMNLLIKKALNSFEQNDVPLSAFYEREIAVYAQILPTFQKLQRSRGIQEKECLKFAKLFKSSTERGKEMLIMNDLTYDGFVMFPDGKIPMDYEHVEAVIKNLARLHAASFILRDTNLESLEELSKGVAATTNMSNDLLKTIDGAAKSILNEVVDTTSKRKAEEVLKNMSAFCKDLLDSKQHEPYNVICHGDIWACSMFFQYKDSKIEDVILIDWQIARFAPPPSDVACCLCLCTDGALLDQHFHRLLEVYYSTLEDHVSRMGGDLSKLYPKFIFDNHVRMYMTFALVVSFLVLPLILNEAGEEQYLEKALETGLNYNMSVINRISQLLDFYGKYDLL